MRFTQDSIRKILACDQIAEGLEFNKRPSNQELIFGHILLMYEEGRRVVPRDLVNLIGCSAESLRLMLRGAERGGFVKARGRPDYEILPDDRLLWEVHKVSQEWLTRNQRRLLPLRPTVREVYLTTQTFDIYARFKKTMTFALKSPLKRGISFFILDRDVHGGVELKRLRHNFPIDHESLRQFINVMIDAGYFEKHRRGKKVFIRPTIALKEALGAIVEDVSDKLNECAKDFSVYSNFIDQLVSKRPEKKTDISRLVSS
ncbi:MAG: hypothetical protein ISP38_04230 [PS1 clade bacterium]|nr:hypothetical protein [PS1 clade bacterium]